MNERLVKISATVGCFVFLAHLVATDVESVAESISFGVSVATAAGVFYDRFVWKLDPFETTPRLEKEYECVISYDHSKGVGSKSTVVQIVQTLSKVVVKLDTDEVRSSSTSASLVVDGDEYFLEYIYGTDSRAVVRDSNPKQDGAAKLRIVTKGPLHKAVELDGLYWTTSNTKGDIALRPKLKG